MNYQDLYIFIKTVDSGSLVAASRLLNIPTSTLSRRIHQFEDQLGYKLIHRNAKKFGVTEAGKRFFSELGPLVHEMEVTSENINSELSTLSGGIRVTAPISLTHKCLKEWIFEFMEHNPKVKVELIISNQNIDLVQNSIDIALRLGKITLSNWVSRPLFKSAFVACSKKDLLENEELLTHPSELNKYPLVTAQRHHLWKFSSESGENYTLSPTPYLRVSEMGFAAEAVKRGLGIGYLPYYVVKESLDKGELVNVLADWSPEEREVHLLYPHRENLPVKTRAFIDFILLKSKTMTDAGG